MVTVALIHSGKSFMPEIAAYQNYFMEIGMPATVLIRPTQPEMERYDILWFFMGMQSRFRMMNKHKIIVHEYCSASTPPYARLKDRIKKLINARPDLRVSLAPEHRGSVFPIDTVPLIIRRQGVHSCFFEQLPATKEYDFVYTGSAVRARHTDRWLHAFVGKFPGARFLLVGNHEAGIVEEFASNTNIRFEAAVPVTSLPALLRMARYAVNYVPDIYPYNMQPSTKLLEYCAAGCRIISNGYGWVNNFSRQMNAGIYFMDDQFTNLSAKNLEAFCFTTPGMHSYKWEIIFEEMDMLQYLTL